MEQNRMLSNMPTKLQPLILGKGAKKIQREKASLANGAGETSCSHVKVCKLILPCTKVSSND